MKVLYIATILLLCVAGISAQKWTKLGYTQTIIGNVAAVGDGSVVFAAGGNNGGTTSIANAAVSIDGGENFENLNIANNTLVFMAGAMASETQGVFAGMSVLTNAEEYTTNGKSFFASIQNGPKVYLQKSQSANFVPGTTNLYGVAGGLGNVDGVSWSDDGGITFTAYDAQSDTMVRYGSYPTATTWYLANGQWPGVNSSSRADLSGTHYPLTAHIDIPIAGGHKVKMFERRQRNQNQNDPDGWFAEIRKTTDGGKTWRQTFSNDTFYFNEISCADENTCYAVGENDDYGVLFGTNDGETWRLIETFPRFSLMAATAISATEVWVGGCIPVENSFIGVTFHTADGGVTFTNYSIPAQYFNHFSFVNSDVGYASTFEASGDSRVLKWVPAEQEIVLAQQ